MPTSRTGKAWPVILLLVVLAMVTPTVMAIDEVVDDYENTTRVDVTDDVIHNATLDCMELNTTGPGGPSYENLTTWVEDDVPGDLTVIPSTVTFTTMRRDSDSLIYLDGGAGNIDDFSIDFTLQVTDIEAGDASNVAIMWPFAVGNANTRAGMIGSEALFIELQQSGTTDDRFKYRFRQREGGAWEVDILDGTLYGLVTHYHTLIRTGTNVTLNVYSDEARTTLIEHLSDAGGSGTNYRYYGASLGYDAVGDPADYSSGNVRNISLAVGAGGYEVDGYFTTTNFLDALSYNATVLLTTTTIPSGSINAQISNDGSTWTDLGALDPGYGALDLRALGVINSTLMFNYTRGLASETPRLYEVRLVHEGPGNGTTTTTTATTDETPYIAIGIILALAMVLIASRSRK